MISEKYFSKYYSAFWKEVFPLANIFSRGMILQSSQGADELTLSTTGRRLSFVSEVGFSMFGYTLDSDILLSQIHQKDEIYKELERNCTARFELYNDDDESLNHSLNHDEYNDAINIAQRLINRFSHAGLPIIISPKFPGCGILDNCIGDIITGDVLFEIKFVNRNFNMKDFRQVVTYCALNYFSKEYTINSIALYNPRRNTQYCIEVNKFAESIAGISFNDLCWKLIYFLSQERNSK